MILHQRTLRNVQLTLSLTKFVLLFSDIILCCTKFPVRNWWLPCAIPKIPWSYGAPFVPNILHCRRQSIYFPVWSSQNMWTRVQHVHNWYYSPQFLHTLNTFADHIYGSYVFEISITLFKILHAFRIKQNVHKSVWKLDTLERSDVAKTDWWLLVGTDIAECLVTFMLRIYSHNKLQFLHSCLHSQTDLLFTVTVRRFW